MLRLDQEHWAVKAQRAIRIAERGREEREAKREEAKRATRGLRRACRFLSEGEG